MHRILGAAILGLVAGLILHRGLGLRFFGAPVKTEAAAPPAGPAAVGAVEAQRLQEARDRRLADLRSRLAAAEQDCADLKAKVAATPRTPREPSRDEKIRRLGGMITRMVRTTTARGGKADAEVQKGLTELMALCRELNVDLTNSATIFRNPEVLGGMFEGILDECGLTGNEDARREWKAALSARLQSLGDDPTSLKIQQLSSENLLDFYARFGEGLFDKDPNIARSLFQMSAGSAVSTSQISRAMAAGLLLKEVATVARLDDPTQERLRPIAERWAAEYAGVIAEATQAHGEKFLLGILSSDKLPESKASALAQVRRILQFRGRAAEIENRAVEEMAGQLAPESASRLRKFDKMYYFQKITD